MGPQNQATPPRDSHGENAEILDGVRFWGSQPGWAKAADRDGSAYYEGALWDGSGAKLWPPATAELASFDNPGLGLR